MLANTTGSNNTAVGKEALITNTTAANHTAIGYYALKANTSGQQNTAVGSSAMVANTTGSQNVAVGYFALDANTTANDNTAIGYQALTSNSTGASNVGVGVNALGGATTGSQNIAIGDQAMNHQYNTITGSQNICIGGLADLSGTAATNSIVLGYNTASVGSDNITIGKGTGADRVYNQFVTNATWTRSSDERIKKDIATNTDCGLDFINDLRTVTYKFKAPSELDASMSEYDADNNTPGHDKKMYGFIAQEVKAALDTHNITDFNGWNQIEDGGDKMQGISYEMFVMPLVKAIQELSAEIEILKAK